MHFFNSVAGEQGGQCSYVPKPSIGYRFGIHGKWWCCKNLALLPDYAYTAQTLGEPTGGIPHLVECECVSLLDELIIKNIDHHTKQKEHWYWSISVNQGILEKHQLIVLLNRINNK